MLCSSCGHDNPRENRYCGMCGTPFPHRFLPVPEEQSALTFPSAPLEIAPSQLSVTPEPISLPVPSVTATVEESLPQAAAETAAAVLPALETPVVEPAPVAEVGEPLGIEPLEVRVDQVAPDQPRSTMAPSTEPPPVMRPAPPADVHRLPAPSVSNEEVQPHSSLPEIRRYATPHPEPPPVHVEAGSLRPSSIPRPPAPQSLEPPPESAGMPTFQAVSEAAGAPPISPFEPPVAKDTDQDRELQEFVASFRYQPPEEAVDELTMRSEVPVLDAEAPVTVSHPSFDDDVPPPPEAGPHPTGEEYYPAANASADRSRYLEIADTHQAAPVRAASTASTTSFLGLDEPSPESAPPPDELAPPARRHWWLWSSLIVLLAIFGTLGFFQGRAQRNPVYQAPIEFLQEHYAKLRQRVSDLTTSATATTAGKPAAEAPPTKEPQPNASTTDKPTGTTDTQAQPGSVPRQNPQVSPATQTAATPDQKPPNPKSAATQNSLTQESKSAVASSVPSASVTPQKPAIDTKATSAPAPTVVKREPVAEPPPAVAIPKSRSDPGQEELAKAMQASDPAAAAAWLWKATSRGNPVAPVRLADMYIKGKGVPHSCEQALVLLRSQAAKDNAPARNRMAALYSSGTCVARDRVKAYQFMSSALAVDPGSEWADQNRKELWQQMTPAERAQVEKSR